MAARLQRLLAIGQVGQLNGVGGLVDLPLWKEMGEGRTDTLVTIIFGGRGAPKTLHSLRFVMVTGDEFTAMLVSLPEIHSAKIVVAGIVVVSGCWIFVNVTYCCSVRFYCKLLSPQSGSYGAPLKG